MKPVMMNKVFPIWCLLFFATGLSWWFGVEAGSITYGAIGIIAIAFVKVRLIIFYFMELSTAPLGWRLVFDGWCVAAFLLLSALYLSGSY